jgi:hypothetical protein
MKIGTPRKLAAKWCWEMPDHPKASDDQRMPALRVGELATLERSLWRGGGVGLVQLHGDQAMPDLLCGQLTYDDWLKSPVSRRSEYQTTTHEKQVTVRLNRDEFRPLDFIQTQGIFPSCFSNMEFQ